MEVGKLTVQLRKSTGKGTSRKLRAAGLIPGVCYGAGLEGAVNISIDPKALRTSLDPNKGLNTVIELSVEDEGEKANQLIAMLWAHQVHPLARNVTHVDLISIDPAKEIDVQVPITLLGKPVGAIEGGQLHTVRHEVNLHCTPANIPGEIKLDVSALNIGDNLHLYDLELPEGVRLAGSDKYTVVTCTAPKAEKVLEEEVTAEEGAEAAAAEGAAAPAADGDAPAAKDSEKK